MSTSQILASLQVKQKTQDMWSKLHFQNFPNNKSASPRYCVRRTQKACYPTQFNCFCLLFSKVSGTEASLPASIPSTRERGGEGIR